jgi:hypothetical protein
MRKKPASESALFHPRSLVALLLCSLGVLLAMASFAATPPKGTLTNTSGPISYTAGPFATSNPTPVIEVDKGPECGTGQACDDFKLTVSLPSGFIANHPHAAIKATMAWEDSGTGNSDYDLYIYKTPRNDCSPSDCTSTNGSQQADAQSASGANPEVATMAVKADSSTYTIVVVPFTSTGETVHVTVEFLPGAFEANSGGGGPTLDANFGGPDPSKPGVPRYMNFYAPAGTSAQESSGEFNIGFNPKTGRIMTMNAGPVWRITPPELFKVAKPECCEGLWEDKSNPTTDFGLDPILWTDQVTGRTFVSNSTAGANAVYAYTDDDGDSYIDGGIAPPNGGADHQSIGTGPYPAALSALGTPVNQGRAVYYCSQDIVGPAECQRSDTLGASYGPGVPAYNGQGSSTPGGTDCGGLHGHVHVAPDGTVWLPVPQCGGKQGGAYSTDAGVTWNEFFVPGAISQPNGADPSIAIDSDNNIYFAYVNNEPVGKGKPPEGHARVAVGKLDLATNKITWSNNFDLGKTHGIKNAVEIEAVGGSSGRAAVGFIGTNVPGDYQPNDFPGRWYAFIATTYDKGQSWVTVNATPNDPVQSKTGVWQQGGSAEDRNLLDFDEITVDAKGRVLYGYSDGCVSATCISGSGPNDFVAYMRVARQTGGKSLFAKNDANTDTTAPIAAKAPCLSGTRDVTASHLTWKAPDNGGSAIVDYYIYRGTKSGAELLSPLGHTGGPRTSFQDTTADPKVKDYFYIVKAVTSLGFGAPSNEIDLKVAPVVIPPLPYSCSGTNVVLDFAGDAKDPAPNFELGDASQADITAISFSASKTTLTTKMTLQNLTLAPSAGTSETFYYVVWTGPNGKQYAAEALAPGPDPSGAAYSYGEWDEANKSLVNSQPTTGTFNTGPNGTITVDVPLTAVGNPTIPVASPTNTPAVRKPYGYTIAGGGVAGVGVTFVAPMDRAPNIDIGYGQSWAVCLPPNAAPTAVLKATPDHGPAPLIVTLDGSGSTDPNAGDTIASYTFEFGDGSNPVTQSSPKIQHTYSSAGEYNARLTVTDSHGLVSLNRALAPVEVNAALRNISTRGNVQEGDDVLIGGLIVTGNQPRHIVLRAIGPSIESGGKPLPGTLQDPTLELHDSTGLLIAKNDNWKTDDTTGQSQQAAVEGTGVPPKNDRESAIVRTLNPGKYTAIVRGKGNTTGLALVEAYDLNPFATSKLANISTRGFVGTGNNVMIGGFVAGPENAAPTTVLIRGLGPSLAAQHVPSPLQDPTLDLRDSNGTRVRANDNWQDTQKAEVQATGIPPSDSHESAIVVEIAPGNYTAILAGKTSTSGNGLVEIYSIQ